MHIDPITLIIAVAVVAAAVGYGWPAYNIWQARRAADKRLNEAIND